MVSASRHADNTILGFSVWRGAWKERALNALKYKNKAVEIQDYLIENLYFEFIQVHRILGQFYFQIHHPGRRSDKRARTQSMLNQVWARAWKILKWNPEPGPDPGQKKKFKTPNPVRKIFKPGTRPGIFGFLRISDLSTYEPNKICKVWPRSLCGPLKF